MSFERNFLVKSNRNLYLSDENLENLEWKFAYEAFNALESSNEFQDRYAPVLPEIKKEELKPVEHRSKSPISKRFL